MENVHLVGISGSLRKASYNTMLLKAAITLMPEGVSLEIISIADIPLYNGDHDLPDAAERPEAVKVFREKLASANGLVIVSPEYNYSIPGVLKNALDWASRGKDSPILNKPVALMGVTPGMWGTNKMQVAFHPVFQAMNMRSVYRPEILVAQAKDKFNEAGELIDEPTKELVKKQLQVLKEMILHSSSV